MIAPKAMSDRHSWISNEIRWLLSKRKNLWDRYTMTRRDEFRMAYRKIQNLCKYMIDKSCIEYERQLVLDCAHYPKRLHSYVKRRTKTSSGMPFLISSTGEATESDETKAERLSEYF